jgi:hypothetical protein
VGQNNDKQELWWFLGFFTNGDTQAQRDPTPGIPAGIAVQSRSGTLLSAPTGWSKGAPAGSSEFDGDATGALTPGTFGFAGLGTVLRRPYGSITPAAPLAAGGSFGTGNRFMNPATNVMTDAPFGVNGQNLHNDTLGWYALIGTHPKGKDKEGFKWHAAFFDNGGDLRPGSGFSTAAEWYGWQLSAEYLWTDFYLLASYADFTSKNNAPADILTDSRRAITPLVNAAQADTDSWAWFTLLNYAWDKRGNVTLRYEEARDSTLAAENRADVWTLGLNYKPSHNSWIQLEWISPDSQATAEDGQTNSIDGSDDMWQLNYKWHF